MRRRYRARQLRRLALGPAAAFFARASAAAVKGSPAQDAVPRPGLGDGRSRGGVFPTQAPVGAGGALRPASLSATAARFARLASTPAVA
ncbi:MAG TPA: hypothetical protein VD769_02960 [Gaiellaceae bacterium]|nr:hypothetical protein [Gaiellaceae bacterium]